MSEDQIIPRKQPMEAYELQFKLYRVDAGAMTGKVVCEDVLSIDFEDDKYFVMNLEGPDGKGREWIGEDESKLEAILKYLRARLGLATAKETV